jgi:hypothetical protein
MTYDYEIIDYRYVFIELKACQKCNRLVVVSFFFIKLGFTEIKKFII